MIGIYKDSLNEDGRLSEKQILTAISWKKQQNYFLTRMRLYYLGQNCLINESEHEHKIPSPFARKLLKLVTGFMFKEGSITYKFPDEAEELEAYIEEVFDCNDEETENTLLAKDQACFGAAYEALYVDNDEAHPQFSRMEPSSVIVVYEPSIRQKPVAAINFYEVKQSNKHFVEAYYSDYIYRYEQRGGKLVALSVTPHQFGDVPIIEYRNNQEGVGDIEPILALIDAHDETLSTSLDEDSKFSDAILLLKNFDLTDEAVNRLASTRVIDGLDDDSEISYLTKPTTYEGRETLRETIEKLIHSLSGIPKLDDQGALEAQSGEAMKYLYATFEMVVAGEKQSGFTNGLQRRLKLLSNFASWLGASKCGSNGIIINWARNLPAEETTIIDNTNKVADRISQKTYLEKLKEADMIDDVDEELRRLEEEREESITAELDEYAVE